MDRGVSGGVAMIGVLLWACATGVFAGSDAPVAKLDQLSRPGAFGDKEDTQVSTPTANLVPKTTRPTALKTPQGYNPPRKEPSLPWMRPSAPPRRGADGSPPTSRWSKGSAAHGPNNTSQASTNAGRNDHNSTFPGLTGSVGNLHVKVHERQANITGGKLADALGRPHKWIVIEDRSGKTIHAPGLGNKRGVPGAHDQSSPDVPFSEAFVRNHADETPRTFKSFPIVDPQCVIAESPYNTYEGRWVPYINDCNSFVDRTISKCQMPNLRTSYLANPETAKTWERLSLFPGQETSPMYKLGVDFDVGKTLSGPRLPLKPTPNATTYGETATRFVLQR